MEFSSKKSFLVRTSINITGFRLVGVFSGLVLDAIIVAVFGMKSQTDAFFTAYTIPLLIATIIGLQVPILQPIYIRLRETEGDTSAFDFLNNVITMCFVILSIICFLGFISSGWIIPLQIPGFSQDTIDTAINLSKLLYVYPVCFVITEICSVILNAHGSFYVPSSIKIFDSISKVIFVTLYYNKYGIFSLAYATLFNSFIMTVFIYGYLRRTGYKFTPSFNFRDPNIVIIGSMSIYLLMGFLATSGIQLFQNFLSSYLPEGNLSALKYATRMTDSLAALLSGGIVAVISPLISKSFANNDMEKMKENTRTGIRLLFFLTIPVIAWLCVMNRELISLLFERLAFKNSDTILLSNLLVLMTPYIFLSRILSLGEIGFFCDSNTRTPLINTLLLAVSNILVTLILYKYCAVYSFSISRSISYIISSLFIIYLFTKRFGSLQFSFIKKDILKVFASSMIMVLFLILGKSIFQLNYHIRFVEKIAAISLPTVVGGVSFIISIAAFGMLKNILIIRKLKI